MGKKKLLRFAENKQFDCLMEFDPRFLLNNECSYKGNWKNNFFAGQKKLIVELGCGRGEYVLGLSNLYPDNNFIGVDVKGSRLYHGAKEVEENNIKNVAFVRSKIDFIHKIFADEVDEFWITFPDPFSEKLKRRLTSPFFLNRYFASMKGSGIINLKTDDFATYQFTLNLAQKNGLKILKATDDLYARNSLSQEETIKTTYEKKFLEQGKKICLLKFILDKEVSPLF
ncbi:MAG: tRNA (guanosine(46)-N7)-methyltransferase TrmB [Candidatus Rifleibacteriota bacterium]